MFETTADTRWGDLMANIKDRLYAKASKRRAPLTGAFELTPMCNFACKMCYVRKNVKEVKALGGLLPLEFWLDIARQSAKAGTMFPLITGGEPFSYPYIQELYEAMIDLGMQVSINSNASLIDEKIIEWLVKRPPERINITLYGASNATYERLCGDPHGFDKVKRAVDLLYKHNIRFKFNCSLTPYNKDDLEDMLLFAKSYGLSLRIATYMFPPVRREISSNEFNERFTPEQAAYYQVLVDYYQLPDEQFAVLANNAANYVHLTDEILEEAKAKGPQEMICLAGRCSFWIDWRGNLSGCGTVDIPKFSLLEGSLEEQWKKIVDYTNEFKYSPVCTNCINKTVCHSCSAMVYTETGNFNDRPVYICETKEYAAKYYQDFLKNPPKKLDLDGIQTEINQDCEI